MSPLSVLKQIAHLIIITLLYFPGCRSDVHVKRRREPIEEDSAETIIVKAQKLTEHKGCPHARDYDDVMQEFIITAVGDYRAHLCAECPMPNHAQETALLNASWAKACQITGINLVRTPQLSKLISPTFAVLLCYFLYTDYYPWLATSWRAQGQGLPPSGSDVQFPQQPDENSDQEESHVSGRIKRRCKLCIQVQ